MGEKLSQLPSEIQIHIKGITQSAGLPDEPESYERIAQAWLEKKQTFEEQISSRGMIELDTLAVDDPKGAVVLTYSGSLVLIGPLMNGSRKAAYNSIGIRKNVPDAMVKENAILAADIKVGAPIGFEVGPVKSTSAVFKIAVCEDKLEAEEQADKISEVTVIMTNEFININKALVPVEG
jgi:hypothetical protein